jgi:hypothetical protein
LFDRPKPTAGCNANGEEKKKNKLVVFRLHFILSD